MSVIEKALQKAKALDAKIVFPESEDPRIVNAIEKIEKEQFAQIVPVDPLDEILLHAFMQVRDIKEPIARKKLQHPLFRAAAMVNVGRADVLVAGVANPTKRVIEATIMGIGKAPGVSYASSFFLMSFPNGRELIFADCGLNIAPNAKMLEEIALASHQTGQRLFGSAHIALLSFSTGESGTGSSVEMVREVAQKTGFLGPIQGDAALNASIATKKGMGNGQANILIFPSLDAGNIAYKLCQELAGAVALGPILQGFAKPVCDLSRGASVDDIVAATAVTIALGT